MMKTTNKLWTIGALLLCSASAGAVELHEGWEKPVMEATMTEVDGLQAGNTDQARDFTLTMTQREDADSPTGFVLTRGRYRLMFGDVETSKDDCGSTEYTAKVENQVVMTLTDHSTRLCEDYRPNHWEMVISDAKTLQPHRYLVGNPEAVFTIQSR